MKVIQFKCNICGDMFNGRDAISGKLLKAIYFTGTKKIEVRDLNAECDTHICNQCLEQLKTQLCQ